MVSICGRARKGPSHESQCPLWIRSGRVQRTHLCPLWANSGHVRAGLSTHRWL